jgi:hypothetical protein
MGLGILAGAAAGAAGTAALNAVTYVDMTVRGRPASDTPERTVENTDSSMASMGISDPRTWSAADWLADLLPHLAYGLVTYATLQALEP